jgi:hypothetical protein
MRKTILIGVVLLAAQIPLLALTLLQQRTWGSINQDEGNEVVLGADGSVYVAGTTWSADGDADAFLLKYGPDRTLAWERTYGTPFNPAASHLDDEFAAGLAVGADGSAYVTGQFGTGVLFVAKFASSGELLWDSTWGDNGTIGTGAAIDEAGHVYVSALSSAINDGVHGTEALILKFDPQGDVVWARAWGGVGYDAARAVTVGSDGIYVAGETNSFFANDAFLVKFDFDGNVAWERDWGVDGVDAPFTGLTAAYGVAADSAGGIYITGNAFDTGHRNNIILVKFSASGDLLWQRIGGPGFGAGIDVAVSADNGAVFVSGNTASDDPDFFGGHAFIAEFSAAGKAKKANSWGGSLDDSASAESVVVGANGLVVTAGFAGPGPHEFGRASNSARTPDAHLVVPTTAHVFVLPTVLGSDSGQELVPDAATGGGTDAFTLWLQPR